MTCSSTQPYSSSTRGVVLPADGAGSSPGTHTHTHTTEGICALLGANVILLWTRWPGWANDSLWRHVMSERVNCIGKCFKKTFLPFIHQWHATPSTSESDNLQQKRGIVRTCWDSCLHRMQLSPVLVHNCIKICFI